MSKLEDGVDVHKLTQVNKICAKTCTPNCYALHNYTMRRWQDDKMTRWQDD